MSGWLTRDEKIAVVTRLFDAFGSGRWDEPEHVMAALADDATWWIAGTLRASGTFTKARMMVSLAHTARLSAGGLAMTPRAWIVEGDRIAVEVDAVMPLRDGGAYRNQYHMAITLAGDRIASIREYMDTHRLGQMLEAARSAPEREGT